MTIPRQELEKYIVGAVSCMEHPDGISYHKCTQRQLAAWARIGDFYHRNAQASTGVRLDFHTDSRQVTFTLRGKKCEVLVNGQIREIFTPGEQMQTYTLSLPEGENRFTLVFGSHDEYTVLKSLQLDDGATLERHVYDCKLLFLGDSITQGYNSQYDCLSYAYRTAFALNGESVINGIGGTSFEPDTFEKTGFEPDAVIVAYGTNDFDSRDTLEACLSKAKAFLRQVRSAYPGKKCFYISPIYRFDSLERPMGSFDACRQALSQVASQEGFAVIDGYTLVPHRADFYADILHHNDLGFSLYSENLLAQLKVYGL